MLSFKAKFGKRFGFITIVVLRGVWLWYFSWKGKQTISLLVFLFRLGSRLFRDFRLGSIFFFLCCFFCGFLFWFLVDWLTNFLFSWLSGFYICLFDLCNLLIVFHFFIFDSFSSWFFILWWKSGAIVNVYVLSFFIFLHFLVSL